MATYGFTLFLSGFCLFGQVSLVGFVTDTPIMSCFYVSVRLRVCVPCFVLERGVRIPALVSWISVWYWGSDIRAPCSVLLCECAVSSSLDLAVCCPRVLYFVWHAACVFYWLHVFMLSYLVWTRGISVFSLAACWCPVLHMAGDLFCWPCACVFVLCEHMVVLVFCVPCALMSIVLTPPILLPDYWLIYPTCVYLITLICSLSNLLVFAVLCQFIIVSTLVVSCLALPGPGLA